MKKSKWFSMLLSAALLLTAWTSWIPVTAAAEESADIYDTYTFEEFLALGEEGICGISDEMAQLYEKWSAETASFHSSIVHYIYVTTGSQYVTTSPDGSETADMEGVRTALSIPDEMRLSHVSKTDAPAYRYYEIQAYMDDAPYDAYTYAYLVTATLVWLEANPAVESVKLEYYGTGGIWEPAPVCTGDANTDGKTSVLDVITISKYNAQQITLNEVQLLAADCNGDGTVNNEDVTALMRYLVELDDAMAAAS